MLSSSHRLLPSALASCVWLVFASGCMGTDAIVTGPPVEDVASGPDGLADAKVDVVVPPDTGPVDTAATCPGGAGCACSKDSECPGSICAAAAKGRTCAAPCKAGLCGAGTICRTLTVAGAEAKLCLPRNPTLCDPCASSSTCATPADPNAHCVALQDDQVGAGGWICAPTCTANTDCPSGYVCGQTARVDGPSGMHCLPGDKKCDCSVLAASSGAQTSCFNQAKDPKGNLIGTCKGVRTCSAQGLSACSAPVPLVETCDGLDNNCNGLKDEGSPCSDGNACTADSCKGAGGCAHADISGQCNDGNPCTDDSCDPAGKGTGPTKGCINATNKVPCTDANACTSGDVCTSGACKGEAVTCDDSNPCTDDACDKVKGCTFTPNKKPCDDSNACTASDTCASGVCAGFVIVCDDKNPCTTDACEPSSGCVASNNAKPCDDGSVCTQSDVCSGGKCSGTAVVCDDGNACTLDVCDAKLGCTHTTQDGSPCDDGNACTAGDACSNANCVTGKLKDCDDGNPCTTDKCIQLAVGCTSSAVADGNGCNDGSACTSGDACLGGKCAGAAVVCDDKNPCTTDSCDAKLGCIVKTASGPACEDGNPCTSPDVCKSGSCTPGLPLDATACGDSKMCVEGVCK